METMACAYVFAWAVLTAYVAWMSVQSYRLGRRLDELERSAAADVASDVDQKNSSSKAA